MCVAVETYKGGEVLAEKRTAVFLVIAAMLCGVLLTMALTQLPAPSQTGDGEGLLASIANRNGLEQSEAKNWGQQLTSSKAIITRISIGRN